jgi:tRNA-uridine 2-sulfurtransferase
MRISSSVSVAKVKREFIFFENIFSSGPFSDTRYLLCDQGRRKGMRRRVSMLNQPERVYALSLLSGGLDSRLAVCVLRAQGVIVHGLCFESPFFSGESARDAAAQLEIPLHRIDFSTSIVRLLDRPSHGFGSQLNPCIDCHAAMIRQAGRRMEEMGFDMVATGEVLDQRPMSQNRRSLEVVANESGYADRLVRPLSAQLLSETLPERQGRLDRSRLLALSGRSRKPQMRLALEYGLDHYPSPAGGCRLTEPNYCKRLRDLMAHGGLNGRRSLDLLCCGRHFRLANDIKLIVGRNERDNVMIEGGAELYDLILKVEGYPGPTGLLPLTATEEQIVRSAAICARYSDSPSSGPTVVKVRSVRETRKISVTAADPAAADALLVS